MRFNKIETKTIRERVYEQLRQMIIYGELLPGQAVSLKELAMQFGISIMPVREALIQLESEKVIKIIRNTSIHVNALTAAEMEEALRIRLLLEPYAAERSCELRPESALPSVKQLFEELKISVENSKEYITKNNQFHFAIYSYAQSPLLLQIIDRLWARITPYFYVHCPNEEFLSQTNNFHEEMLRAFCDKDKEKIKDAINRDLKNAAQYIIPLLGIPNQANRDAYSFFP